MTRDEFIADWNERFTKAGLVDCVVRPHNDRGCDDGTAIALYDDGRMRMAFLTGVTRLADAYLHGYIEGRLERDR